LLVSNRFQSNRNRRVEKRGAKTAPDGPNSAAAWEEDREGGEMGWQCTRNRARCVCFFRRFERDGASPMAKVVVRSERLGQTRWGTPNLLRLNDVTPRRQCCPTHILFFNGSHFPMARGTSRHTSINPRHNFKAPACFSLSSASSHKKNLIRGVVCVCAGVTRRDKEGSGSATRTPRVVQCQQAQRDARFGSPSQRIHGTGSDRVCPLAAQQRDATTDNPRPTAQPSPAPAFRSRATVAQLGPAFNPFNLRGCVPWKGREPVGGWGRIPGKIDFCTIWVRMVRW
jgi:hypothetical protein